MHFVCQTLLHIDVEEAKRAIKAALFRTIRWTRASRRRSAPQSAFSSLVQLNFKTSMYADGPSYEDVHHMTRFRHMTRHIIVWCSADAYVSHELRRAFRGRPPNRSTQNELLSALWQHVCPWCENYQGPHCRLCGPMLAIKPWHGAYLLLQRITPAQVVAAAAAVEPNAAAIPSSGRVISETLRYASLT